MKTSISIEPLTEDAFCDFGDVLDTLGEPDALINQGNCGRWHDLARLDFTGGRSGISLFQAVPRALPLALDMVERHPLGSQAFIPMSDAPFLVIVAKAEADGPGRPRAFRTTGFQAINFHRGTWHGVLTPLTAPGRFAVVDRIGQGENLEEHWFREPFLVVDD